MNELHQELRRMVDMVSRRGCDVQEDMENIKDYEQ